MRDLCLFPFCERNLKFLSLLVDQFLDLVQPRLSALHALPVQGLLDLNPLLLCVACRFERVLIPILGLGDVEHRLTFAEEEVFEFPLRVRVTSCGLRPLLLDLFLEVCEVALCPDAPDVCPLDFPLGVLDLLVDPERFVDRFFQSLYSFCRSETAR